MAWKLKKNDEIERKSHSGPLYLGTDKGYEKRKLIMWYSRYQSVIIANLGFAPQISQKLWASENSPTHYLDSWVKIWATHPMPLTSLIPRTVWNFELKFSCNLLKHKGTHEASFVKICDGDLLTSGPLEPEWPYIYLQSNLLVQYFYYISWKIPITLCVGFTFRNDFLLHFAYLVLLHFVKILYYIMRRYYISQQFSITLCVGITFRNDFLLHNA